MADLFDNPKIKDILAYRGVHVLNDVGGNGLLKASHYAICLVFGKEPVWGVWTVAGKFLRFYGSRQDIAEAYPHKSWRRKMASWNFGDISDTYQKVKDRINIIEHRYEASASARYDRTKPKE